MSVVALRIDLLRFSKEALALYIVKHFEPEKILNDMEKIELDIQLENVSLELFGIVSDMKMFQDEDDSPRRTEALEKLHNDFDETYKRQDALLRKRFMV